MDYGIIQSNNMIFLSMSPLLLSTNNIFFAYYITNELHDHIYPE